MDPESWSDAASGTPSAQRRLRRWPPAEGRRICPLRTSSPTRSRTRSGYPHCRSPAWTCATRASREWLSRASADSAPGSRKGPVEVTVGDQVRQDTTHIEAESAKLADHVMGPVHNPGAQLGRDCDRRIAGEPSECALAEVVLDHTFVLLRCQIGDVPGIDTPEQLGAVHGQRGVVRVRGIHQPGGRGPQHPEEARGQDARGGPGWAVDDEVDPLRGDLGPSSDQAGDVQDPVQGEACTVGRFGTKGVDQCRIRVVGAVAEVLLPLRRDLSHRVACRDDQVNLMPREVRGQAPDGARIGECEQLMGDDRRARSTVEGFEECLPGVQRVGAVRGAVQGQQLSNGPVVVVGRRSRVEDPSPTKLDAVAPEQGLQVRRPGLGRPDVDEDAATLGTGQRYRAGPPGRQPTGRSWLPQRTKARGAAGAVDLRTPVAWPGPRASTR